MSRLIVPTAGTSPGRTAQAPQLPTPQLGQAIGDLGTIALQVGSRLEEDRLQRDMQRNTIDLTRDMNQLRLDVEGMGDPDTAETAWQQGVDGLRTAYLGEEDAQGRIDRKNVDDFGLAFDELANRNAFSLGRRTLGMRQAERSANFVRYAHEATRAAATSDGATREILIEQGDEIIGQNLSAGVIDAAEAERQRIALRGDVSNARAIAMIDENPQAFLDEAGSGGFGGLEADTLARYSVQATNVLEAQAEAAAREAEKAAQERERQIATELVNMREIAKSGRKAVDERLLSNPEYQASPEFGQTAAMIELRREKIDLTRMTPSQIRAQIRQEEGRDLSVAWQTERLEVLRGALDTAVEGYARDPIAFGAEQGLIAEEEIDFSADPAALAQSVLGRVQAGQTLVAGGYTDTLAVFTEDERAEVRARVAATEDPQERAVLAATLAATLPTEGPDTLRGMSDPVFAHVGALGRATRSSRLGAEILRGQEALARSNVQLPPVGERAGAAFDVVDQVFADIPGGEGYQQAATAAADALYARRQGRLDPAGDFDEDTYQQALHEVMGGTGAYGASGARGGIGDVMGRQTILPQGTDPSAVEDALDRLGTVSRPTGPLQFERDRFDPETMQAQLRTAGGGQVPEIGGAELDADAIGQLQIQAVGDDRYVFVMPGRNGARSQVVMADGGGEYVFSLRGLMAEVAE